MLIIINSCKNEIDILKPTAITPIIPVTYNIYMNYNEENQYYYEAKSMFDNSWYLLKLLGKTDGITYTKEDSIKYCKNIITKDTFNIIQTNDTLNIKNFVDYQFNFYHGDLTTINYTYYKITEIKKFLNRFDYSNFNRGISATEFPIRFVKYYKCTYKNYKICKN